MALPGAFALAKPSRAPDSLLEPLWTVSVPSSRADSGSDRVKSTIAVAATSRAWRVELAFYARSSGQLVHA